MESIHQFCDTHPELQLPDGSQMSRRTRFGVASGNQMTSPSSDSKQTTGHSNDSTLHVSEQILIFLTEYKQLQARFSPFERLVDYNQCLALLRNDDADEAILGPGNLYNPFSEPQYLLCTIGIA
ncbi:hypothetical protein CNMCM8980_010136 [Aspergillus fumigatiaffinis]|uniref:Uncharacterized protein n=1 Tax=Aspergillus fumigatiaffinis TaxID=340414 RepID=A0A8H4HEN6_9EURO|nr:hypothetical protein CNMCM6805_002084 [Aspergillus fumigatiaffinis]KAF4250814.1 hypothetical protein CNMCM8980_010136 [Aspergillus fumigatiaffinis]